MSRLPLWLRRCATGVAGLLLFAYLTLLLIPSTELQSLAIRFLAPHGLTMTSATFGKAFPLGIRAGGVILAGQSGKVLNIDRFALKLKLLPLLIGRVIMTGEAAIGPGLLTGEAEITRSGLLSFTCSKLRLEDIPFFETVAGTKAKGELRFKGSVRGRGATATGDLQMEVRELDLRGVKISGTPLPDASYRTMQGKLKIAGGRTTLESVTLQGDGLYARLSGDLPSGGAPAATPLNLKLELMPKPEFLESQKFIFLLLVKYLTTPGHYLLPIGGTLAAPALQ